MSVALAVAFAQIFLSFSLIHSFFRFGRFFRAFFDVVRMTLRSSCENFDRSIDHKNQSASESMYILPWHCNDYSNMYVVHVIYVICNNLDVLETGERRRHLQIMDRWNGRVMTGFAVWKIP